MDSEDFKFDFSNLADVKPYTPQPAQPTYHKMDRGTLSKQLLPAYSPGKDVTAHILEVVDLALTTDLVFQLFPEVVESMRNKSTVSVIEYNRVFNLTPIRSVCNDFGLLYDVLTNHTSSDYRIDEQWCIFLRLVRYDTVNIMSQTLTETDIREALNSLTPIPNIVSIDHYNNVFRVRFETESEAAVAGQHMEGKFNLTIPEGMSYSYTFKYTPSPNNNTHTDKFFDKDRRNKKRNGGNRGGRGRGGGRGRNKKKNYSGYNNSRYMKRQPIPQAKPEQKKQPKNVEISGDDFPPLAQTVAGYSARYNKYDNNTIARGVTEGDDKVEWKGTDAAIMSDAEHTTLEIGDKPVGDNNDWHMRKGKGKSNGNQTDGNTTGNKSSYASVLMTQPDDKQSSSHSSEEVEVEKEQVEAGDGEATETSEAKVESEGSDEAKVEVEDGSAGEEAEVDAVKGEEPSEA